MVMLLHVFIAVACHISINIILSQFCLINIKPPSIPKNTRHITETSKIRHPGLAAKANHQDQSHDGLGTTPIFQCQQLCIYAPPPVDLKEPEVVGWFESGGPAVTVWLNSSNSATATAVEAISQLF
jgi:hypothetical protein